MLSDHWLPYGWCTTTVRFIRSQKRHFLFYSSEALASLLDFGCGDVVLLRQLARILQKSHLQRNTTKFLSTKRIFSTDQFTFLFQRFHNRNRSGYDCVIGEQDRITNLDDPLQSWLSRICRLHQSARRFSNWWKTSCGWLEAVQIDCVRLVGHCACCSRIISCFHVCPNETSTLTSFNNLRPDYASGFS